MEGFKIDLEGKPIHVALENGNIHIIVSGDRNNYNLSVTGSTTENRFVWYTSEMDENSSFTVEIGEVTEMSPPLEIKENEDERLLHWYNHTKEQLIKKGLLKCKE